MTFKDGTYTLCPVCGGLKFVERTLHTQNRRQKPFAYVLECCDCSYCQMFLDRNKMWKALTGEEPCED